MSTGAYTNFFQTSLLTTIKRMILCGPFGVISQLPILLIPKKSHFIIIVVFKTLMPTLVGNLYIFGFSKTLANKFGFINKEITKGKEIVAGKGENSKKNE